MTVTFRDLARLSNTSLVTVSRALNNQPGVSPAKRQSILDLAQALGYQPNQIAQSLSTRRSMVIGYMASHLRNAAYVDYLYLLEQACRERGFKLMVADAQKDPIREQENLENMLQQRVAGLLVLPVSDYCGTPMDYFLRLQLQKLPLVVLGGTAGLNFDCIVSEEIQSTRVLIQKLVAQGHRRFGFLSQVGWNNRAARERLEGVRRVLEEEGLIRPDGQPLRGCLFFQDNVQLERLEFLRTWFGADNRPTALVCVNDVMALNLYRPLAQWGLSIPRDVSLVAYDDSYFSSRLVPALTVLAPNKKKLAQEAIEALFARIEDPARPPVFQSVPQELIERESTAPPLKDLTCLKLL